MKTEKERIEYYTKQSYVAILVMANKIEENKVTEEDCYGIVKAYPKQIINILRKKANKLVKVY